MQRVPVDLADGTVIGPDLGLQADRQIHLRQTFEDLLSIPVVGGFVVKDQTETGETEDGNGAQMVEMRDTVYGDFKRNRHLLLDLFGGMAWPLSDDLDVIVGDVRVRFDRKIVERNCAPDQQECGGDHNQKSIVQRKINEDPDHAD